MKFKSLKPFVLKPSFTFADNSLKDSPFVLVSNLSLLYLLLIINGIELPLNYESLHEFEVNCLFKSLNLPHSFLLIDLLLSRVN